MTSNTAVTFMHNVSKAILNPLIVLVFAVALIVFLYGLFEFVWKADNEDARGNGRRHMFWGIFGLFIMMSVFGIIKFIATTVGSDTTSIQTVLPL